MPIYQGFNQAAATSGCDTVSPGTADYDITKKIATAEWDPVKTPAGILPHPMQFNPFIEPINRAIGSGTELVTFAADIPNSNRSVWFALNDPAKAKCAAEEFVKQVATSLNTRFWNTPASPITNRLYRLYERALSRLKLVVRQATNQDTHAA